MMETYYNRFIWPKTVLLKSSFYLDFSCQTLALLITIHALADSNTISLISVLKLVHTTDFIFINKHIIK